MKSLKAFLILIVSCCCLPVFAAPKTITKADANRLAVEYYQLVSLQKSTNKKSLRAQPPGCDPQEGSASCTKILCDKTGDCQFSSSFNEIANACRGSNGDCVDVLCEKTGDCHFRSLGIEIANSCKRSNGECVRIGCEKTGDCHFRSLGREIAEACQGVYDSECVRYGCERTGSCNFRSNFIEIARSCAGF